MTTRDSRESPVKSLFVVSLPRSLSTVIYHAAIRSVGLDEPRWTSDGEILNLDRFVLFPGPRRDVGRKFLRKDSEPDVFFDAMAFLDQVAAPTGYGYKDVVQPFLVSEWITRSGVRAIRIKRSVADVAYAMLNGRWRYPARLFPRTKDVELALLKGLVLADRALDAMPAQQIDFDQIILDEAPVQAALATLYGHRPIKRVRFIDVRFKQVREQILKRRQTSRHRAIADRVAKVLERHRR